MTDGHACAPLRGSAARPPALSDEELLTLASSGGAEAREELARRHRNSAYLLALQLLGNRDDALDVAQESLLRLFSNLGRLAPGRAIGPWLLTIVRNQARDFWRRQRVRRTESIDASPDAFLSQIVDTGPDPEETVRQAELRRRVWRAIAALSADHREIVVMRDFHGLSYDELALALGIRIGTVMSRLHAARQRLRALLAEEGVHA
jgi:RNA polymerase sigma-70 factor (ECF subfamily)